MEVGCSLAAVAAAVPVIAYLHRVGGVPLPYMYTLVVGCLRVHTKQVAQGAATGTVALQTAVKPHFELSLPRLWHLRTAQLVLQRRYPTVAPELSGGYRLR